MGTLKNLVVAALLGACGVSSDVVQCENDRICPEATVCDEEHLLCVLPEQVTQCAQMPDRMQCDVAGRLGACQDGVCLEVSCGNNRVDLEMATACAVSPCLPYEVCDDGNNMDGDGCSGNCLSEERCGNSLVDAANDEQCDDGNLLDHDGCSSGCKPELSRWVQVGSPGPISAMRAVYDASRDRVVMVGGRINIGASIFAVSTSAVSEWNGMWHRNVPTATQPAPRDVPGGTSLAGVASFGLAYDHERRVTVMAGGNASGTSLRETWGWDGVNWIRLANLPYPVEYAAMAYDARRKRIVLFGGETYGSVPIVHNKTLEFDGTTWTDVSPAVSPSARTHAAMAYDPKRGVIVMYGGRGDSGSGAPGELWTYDGTSWTLRVGIDNTTHPSITFPMMAFDGASDRMIIYGGDFSGDSQPNDMMLWDGTNLARYLGALPMGQAPAPSSTTSVRSGAMLVQSGTRRVMLYGGQDRGSFSNSPRLLVSRLQWFWDGTQWIEADGEPTPVVFAAATNVFDAGAIIRFGGSAGVSSLPPATGETWELTRRGWQRFSTADPPGLITHGMTYDSGRDQVVMFGGLNASGQAVNTTWTRAGSTWTSHVATGTWPSARATPALAYDEARGETLLFGGSIGNAPQGDMWAWDGTTWAPKLPANLPSARSGAAMGYDRAAGVIVLFGGGGNNVQRADTWIWNGTDWTEVTTTSTDVPEPRSIALLTWNPARQSLVLTFDFDPYLTSFETWEWRTTSVSPPAGQWTRIGVGTRPPFRALGASFTSLDGSGVSILQGADSVGVVDDQWELRWDVPHATDSCRTPYDVDGDALVACADPDCWRTCTPECLPGTSCAPDAPRCGDGICGVTENCRICPQDCTTCVDMQCGDLVCDPSETCAGDCP